MAIYQFEYHTFLHHSQTRGKFCTRCTSLSTIHFYIILKHMVITVHDELSLSTIHFYIILKRQYEYAVPNACLSTIHFYIILKPQI